MAVTTKLYVMAAELDYYAILQVHPRAETEVIEAAYRRLAIKYHPDINKSPEAAQRMKQINAAYEVLSDPQQRRAYDATRGRSSEGAFSTQAPVLQMDVRKLVRVLLTIAAIAISLGFMRLSPNIGLLMLVILLVLWTYSSVSKRRRW